MNIYGSKLRGRKEAYYLNVENCVTTVDHIKWVVRICFLGAISNLKFDWTVEPNCPFQSKRNHIYRQVNADNMHVKALSHVKVTSTNATAHIQDFLARLKIQLCNKFFCCLCSKENSLWANKTVVYYERSWPKTLLLQIHRNLKSQATGLPLDSFLFHVSFRFIISTKKQL